MVSVPGALRRIRSLLASQDISSGKRWMHSYHHGEVFISIGGEIYHVHVDVFGVSFSVENGAMRNRRARAKPGRNRQAEMSKKDDMAGMAENTLKALWGENGLVTRIAARAWKATEAWMDDNVPGFPDALMALYREDVKRKMAARGTWAEGGAVDHSRCDARQHDFAIGDDEESAHASGLRLCNHCLAPCFWCENDKAYHHAGKGANPCFLIQEPGQDVAIPEDLWPG